MDKSRIKISQILSFFQIFWKFLTNIKFWTILVKKYIFYWSTIGRVMEFWDMANQIFFPAKSGATILAFNFGGLGMNFTIVPSTWSNCSKYFPAVRTFDSPTDASAICCQAQVQTSRDSKKVDHVCKTIRKICLFVCFEFLFDLGFGLSQWEEGHVNESEIGSCAP